MRISSLVIENFKVFKGKHSFEFPNNLIFLVGENNTGKSTLFEAISFVKTGLPEKKKVDDIKNKFVPETDHIVCTIKLKGNIKEVIRDFSESKYEPYVFEEDGVETLLVQRSSEERVITQNSKPKTLTVKTVTIWNPESSQFENPSGIDTVLSTLFESQFVWADTDPTDISDFGSTKICGRLLNGAVGNFFESNQWKRFTDIHKETFIDGDESLSKRTESVETKIKEILKAQYGEVGVRFNFALPETSAFYKAGNIRVHDGVETELEEKGTGLQRAIALAMIQVYAQNLTIHPTDAMKQKPLFFFIDEPEICLHPKAQTQLMEALTSLSETQQIFVSTHSPYLLKCFDPSKNDLFICKKVGNNVEITPSNKLKSFSWSPSWGEINYFAYDMPTMEFHDELYGAVHEKFISSASTPAEANTRCQIKTFDLEVLAGNNLANQVKQWSELKSGIQKPSYGVTTTTFIRHSMHHPESRQSSTYSRAELKASIEHLISLL